MKLTDEKAIKLLKKVNALVLEEQIDSYPDDERDDRSDMKFLADEVSYQIMMYNEDGSTWKDDLADARTILNRTKYGKRILIDPRTMMPIYTQSDIWSAKERVNEYRRLYRLLKRLQDSGYYGEWYMI